MSTIKLAVDAGHGMSNVRSGVFDPGAEDDGFTEADIALAWALTLKAECIAAGIPVFLVREGKTDSNPVGGRDEQGEAAGCNMWLSIHLNSADSTSASGCETFYRSAADKTWAETVQAACVAATGLKSRGVKSEGQSQHPRLAVLDFDNGPACLVEVGFISNTSDREKLRSRDVRIAFADFIVLAIKLRAAAKK